MADGQSAPRPQGASPWTKLILGLLFLVIIFFTLNYLGFCYSTMRFISDQEKIEAAVRWTIRKESVVIPIKTDRGTTYTSVPFERYSTVQDFLRRNPSCCRVGITSGDDIPKPSFIRRILGLYADIVEVNLTVSYTTNGESKVVPVRRSWAVTACGRVITDFSI